MQVTYSLLTPDMKFNQVFWKNIRTLVEKVKYKNRMLAWKRKQYVCHASFPDHPLSAFFTEKWSATCLRFTWNITSSNMWNNRKINFRKWQDGGSDSWLFLQAAIRAAMVVRHRQNESAFLFPSCSAKNSATKKI